LFRCHASTWGGEGRTADSVDEYEEVGGEGDHEHAETTDCIRRDAAPAARPPCCGPDCRGRSGATMYPASGEVVSDLTASAWVAVRLVTRDTHSVQVVAN
jgi:hypothetical protein